MIIIPLPAVMRCPAQACTREAPVELCLLNTGTLGFRPTEKGWQIIAPGKPGAAFIAHCPEHHQKVNVIHAPQMLQAAKPLGNG